jgi:hypothetical protein
LPIACSLDAADGARRMEQWRRLGEHAQLDAHRDGHTLAITYRPLALAELQRLVEAERSCCSFLAWSLSPSPDRVVLTIQADDAGDPELSRLAGLFGASG